MYPELTEGGEKEKPMVLKCYGSRSQRGGSAGQPRTMREDYWEGKERLTRNDDIVD